MGIFDWFGKKNEEMYVEEVPNTNMVPDYYTIEEMDCFVELQKAATEELRHMLLQMSDKHEMLIKNLREDVSKLEDTVKDENVTKEELQFVIASLSSALREEIELVSNKNVAIVDPAPVSTAPPAGWMYAIQDEILNKTEMAKAEVKAYVDDCFNAFEAEEDLELEERLSNLSPLSAEEIDALYMDEAETTTLAQKSINGFRAELYNKAVNDLKLIPTSKATIAAVRAFLVKFVESMKPV